jgi:hypothetical protein
LDCEFNFVQTITILIEQLNLSIHVHMVPATSPFAWLLFAIPSMADMDTLFYRQAATCGVT